MKSAILAEITREAIVPKRLFFGKGRELPHLNPRSAADLRKRLTPEIEEVERIIGRDLSAWKA